MSDILSFCRMVKFEFNEQIEFLQQLEKTGSLDEYLEKDPNFMYSLISDPRMDENSINSVVTTLITAGIDSVSILKIFIASVFSRKICVVELRVCQSIMKLYTHRSLCVYNAMDSYKIENVEDTAHE